MTNLPFLRAVAVAVIGAVAFLAPTTAHADPDGRADVRPLERAHAHNDYEHDRPLLDALDHGFTSAEADVWLVDGQLYIGHDAPDMSRTLASTYLEPLAQRVRANNGRVYPHRRESFRLLIDVKNEGSAAWPVIERELAKYPSLMTTVRKGRVFERAVTAVISGDRDLEAMRSARVRRSFYDGRLGDLESGLPSSLVAMISDNWGNHFSWNGVGPMPTAEREKLHHIVETAHAEGYDVRFWATPDLPMPNREAIWRELLAADVDALNTDHLADLQAFLLAENPQEG